jgi:hypothetical protein
MLMPDYFALIYQGKKIDCSQAIAHKVVQRAHIQFLNKGVLEEYLSRGAALVVEGLDIVFPEINAFCAAIDESKTDTLSNAVVFIWSDKRRGACTSGKPLAGSIWASCRQRKWGRFAGKSP